MKIFLHNEKRITLSFNRLFNIGHVVVNVKTARGRKISSTKWLHRQINDPYVALAKKDGYRSRSAYKLIEIDNKLKILERGKYVLDLGSCPGGWTQVASQRVTVNGATYVTAVDVKPMDEIPYVNFVQCDITENTSLRHALGNKKFDVVLSDVAPKSCGYRQVDHANIISLCEVILNIATNLLRTDGSFVTKILQGEYEKEFYQSLKHYFQSCLYVKPKASRSESSEIYLAGLKFTNGKPEYSEQST